MKFWLLVSTCVVAGVVRPVRAQIPDTFTNLKVLPRDIRRPQLIGIMRGVAGGLGVRCNHCHVGPDDLQGMDFATDSLETKRKAREMFRMVQAINRDFIPRVARDSADRIEVTCNTCHRGLTRPELLEDVLARIARRDGTPAATAKYRALREEFYGSGSYDFGEFTLIAVAERLGGASTARLALDMLDLNLEFYPRSAATFVAIGRTRLTMEDTAAAIAGLERALELRPGDRFIARELDRLRRRP